MIKIEHVVLPSPEQMEFIIEGMRNPKNSWDRSDSFICDEFYSHVVDCDICPYHEEGIQCPDCEYIVGPNDLKLMNQLSEGGPVHSKYMRMMIVMLRVTAPLYWWKEFDTYKLGTVSNSCSTMHKIHEREFEWDDFSWEHLRRVRDSDLGESAPTLVFDCTINALNYWRNKYQSIAEKLKENDLEELERVELTKQLKECWWQLIQLLPSSYNQTRNVMLNYEVLKNIYTWRKAHKLDEWVDFCKWIESLPNSELITGKEDK